jgi:hypothetical protein
MNWYKTAIKKEAGLFSFPMHVFKDIRDHVANAYYKIAEEDPSKITKAGFPAKIFDLDFSGTKWEYLNELNPKTKISFFRAKGEASEMLEYGNGQLEVSFNLYEPLSMMFASTIEHELLHILQTLIKHYREKHGRTNPVDEGFGGLPPYKLIDPDLDVEGFKKGPDHGAKRVEHTKRPIENYTDLLTMVRELQYAYMVGSYSDLDKAEYFRHFLDPKGRSDIFIETNQRALAFLQSAKGYEKSFKKIDPELHKLVIQKAYNEFVNNEAPESINEISDHLGRVKELNEQREQLQEEQAVTEDGVLQGTVVIRDKNKETTEDVIIIPSDFDKLGSIKIEGMDRAGLSDLEDDNYSFVDEMVGKLPHMREREDQYGEFNVHIGTKFKQIVSIFKNIKAYKEKYKDEFWPIENYDYFAKSISEEVANHFRRKNTAQGRSKSFDPEELYQRYYVNA